MKAESGKEAPDLGDEESDGEAKEEGRRGDNLAGDSAAERKLVQDTPSVCVEVGEARHLMAAEQLEQINALVTTFFEEG